MASHHLFFPLFLLFILIQTPPYSASSDYYTACSSNFSCGNIQNLGFPFYGNRRPKECGYPSLNLNCDGKRTYIAINGVEYLVQDAKPENRILRIARKDYLNGLCPSKLIDSRLDPNLFDYRPDYKNIRLIYGCPAYFGELWPGHFTCSSINGVSDGFGYAVWDGTPPNPACGGSVVVPVDDAFVLLDFGDLGKLQQSLREGFYVKWIAGVGDCEKCRKSEEVCGYDWRINQTTCYLDDRSSATPDKKQNKAAIAGGVAAGIIALVAIALGFWFIRRRKKRIAERSKSNDLLMAPPLSGGFTRATSTTISHSQSVPSEASSKVNSFQKSYYFGVQVFSYEELEEATNNFDSSRELGDGGFGAVYYGKLKDGRVVAVKRLYERNFRHVEQFMNEVKLLATLRHKNLVALYGCTSKKSQGLLLVYEYIPNGTVADHIHGEQGKSSVLRWPTRLKIAVEIAEALTYLHRSDVIHRDVKTNNILLDNNFTVKVGDFGLSRLFPTHVTHVSTAPQGTPGYVDPEYYQNYQLTDKSDVYSFGVVLIELISSLEAVDVKRNRSDVNLANMATNKIQTQALHELVDPYLGFERDNATRRMITAVAEVAFRCLQPQRDVRPSMEEVWKILKGIHDEEYGAKEATIVDIKDHLTLLKNSDPPLSPDSVADHRWVSGSTTASNSS